VRGRWVIVKIINGLSYVPVFRDGLQGSKMFILGQIPQGEQACLRSKRRRPQRASISNVEDAEGIIDQAPGGGLVSRTQGGTDKFPARLEVKRFVLKLLLPEFVSADAKCRVSSRKSAQEV
jgi:hypothetical protein